MNENANTNGTGDAGNTASQENATADATKTFTQDDVNRIVGERLSKEKTRFESEFAQKEAALARKEFMLAAKGKLHDRGASG